MFKRVEKKKTTTTMKKKKKREAHHHHTEKRRASLPSRMLEEKVAHNGAHLTARRDKSVKTFVVNYIALLFSPPTLARFFQI